MNPQLNFQKLSPIERAEYINSLLVKETNNHLKNVAKYLNLHYATFCKEMREGGFAYSKAKNRYEKTLSLEEYREVELANRAQNKGDTESGEIIRFIGDNLDQLKSMLTTQKELILDPKVYSSAKSVTKTMVFSKEVFEEFSSVCMNEFPHYRIKDLTSQCLLDFVKQYQKKTL